MKTVSIYTSYVRYQSTFRRNLEDYRLHVRSHYCFHYSNNVRFCSFQCVFKLFYNASSNLSSKKTVPNTRHFVTFSPFVGALSDILDRVPED